MSNLRVATLWLVALLLAALLTACSQPSSGGLGPGSTEGTFALDVIVQGTGSVVIEDLDFDCNDDCTARIGAGVTVELQAQSNGAQGFAGWQGACSGTGTCTVTMDSDKTVTAVFADNVLVLDLQGDGQASVRIEPGDDCTSDCVRAYDSPVQVSLHVNPAADSEAAGFGGACSDSDRDDFCLVTVQGQVDVSATINIRRFTLNVGTQGSGSVTGSGIDCPGDCSAEVTMGSQVSLEADPASGWEFVRWDGAGCGTNPTCEFPMNADEEVSAVFRQRFLLATRVVGGGLVTSSPGGIDCGDDCEATFSQGTEVTLDADPDAGWTFSGWSGDCSGTGGCSVTMNAKRSVTATFVRTAPTEHDLSIDIIGTGTVTGNGISCSSDCIETVEAGSTVDLTASAPDGWTFTGWSGDCNGSDGCNLTMNGDRRVTATFEETVTTPPPPDPTLSIRVEGSGSGSVSGYGSSCTSECDVTYQEPTDETLTATADEGSTFTGWSGECEDTSPTCSFRVEDEHEVIATFDLAQVQHQLEVDVTGEGTVSSEPGGIDDCSSDCVATYPEGTNVSVSPDPAEGHQFGGWSGCDSESGDECSVTMDGPRSVTASFSPLEATFTLDLEVDGPGTVAMDPGGVTCSEECTEEYEQDTEVTLTAQPDPEATYTWNGDCSETEDGTCDLRMDGNKSVSITFLPGDDEEEADDGELAG